MTSEPGKDIEPEKRDPLLDDELGEWLAGTIKFARSAEEDFVQIPIGVAKRLLEFLKTRERRGTRGRPATTGRQKIINSMRVRGARLLAAKLFAEAKKKHSPITRAEARRRAAEEAASKKLPATEIAHRMIRPGRRTRTKRRRAITPALVED